MIETADIFITATGNLNIITVDHMERMKDKAIVGNIGHFDNEIDMAGLKKAKGIERINIKPQYDEWQFADGHSVMVLAEGRLLNLGCATGHPSFVMSASFTNQVLAQLELHANAEKYGKTVTMLPKTLDEEVARLHLDHLGVKLTKLTPEQADYIGVPKDGPYKPDHYRSRIWGSTIRPVGRSGSCGPRLVGCWGGSGCGISLLGKVLEELEKHGIRPRPTTPPELVHEFVSDLYRYELRRLRDRLRRGEIPKEGYIDRVVELRLKYPLVSLKPHQLVE